MNVQGYKVSASLEGATLTATADGRVGRAALGTDVRAIELGGVTALKFKPAGRMANGSLELVDSAGKTVLHFRHKDNAAWEELYARVNEHVPTSAVGASTKGVRLTSEDRDAFEADMQARADERFGPR